MNIWAIADLHLAFGVPEKSMEIFGPQWRDYAHKIQKAWQALVHDEDLVLISGDISWAKDLNRAVIDLQWIDSLPGTKVMIRGNHDYWWSSPSKVRHVLPSSIHIIQNDAFHFQNIAVVGARLWDSFEYSYENYIDFKGKELTSDQLREQERIFQRELERLELSLKALKKEDPIRIAMTHYPPIGPDLKPSRASMLLEKYGISICVFGHLHNVKPGGILFLHTPSIQYHLTSSDYLNFTPLKIYSSAK